MKSLLLRTALAAMILLPLCSYSAAAQAPDCSWSAYGCDYRAYLHGDGAATILVDCDDDYTHVYEGSGASCP